MNQKNGSVENATKETIYAFALIFSCPSSYLAFPQQKNMLPCTLTVSLSF